MKIRSVIVAGIIVVNFGLLLMYVYYKQSYNNVVVEDVSFEDIPQNSNTIVALDGLYKVVPESNSMNINIFFSEDSNSLWIVSMDDVVDSIPKKFAVKGDKLFITHNRELMQKELAEYKKTGNEKFANVTAKMVNSLPTVDIYQLSMNSDSTISLTGKKSLKLKKLFN